MSLFLAGYLQPRQWHRTRAHTVEIIELFPNVKYCQISVLSEPHFSLCKWQEKEVGSAEVTPRGISSLKVLVLFFKRQ